MSEQSSPLSPLSQEWIINNTVSRSEVKRLETPGLLEPLLLYTVPIQGDLIGQLINTFHMIG